MSTNLAHAWKQLAKGLNRMEDAWWSELKDIESALDGAGVPRTEAGRVMTITERVIVLQAACAAAREELRQLRRVHQCASDIMDEWGQERDDLRKKLLKAKKISAGTTKYLRNLPTPGSSRSRILKP